jgi:tetratricopeptide (TPR) repeat protein
VKTLSAASKELMFKPNLENYGYGFGIRKTSLGPHKIAVPVIEHNGGINGFNTLIVRLIGEKRLIVLLDNTSQGRYLDGIALAITNILYEQPYDTPKQSIAETLRPTAIKDVAAAVKQYRELKATRNSEYDFREQELNALGYQLLQTKNVSEAIEIFKLNVEAYPQAANTYDSLGEAYLAAGDKEHAMANYKKSLELNPQNTSASRALASLTGAQKETVVDAKSYESYAGAYELAPNFVITITVEDGKLMGTPTGQPKAELYPTSETEFYLKIVDAQVTFVKSEQGVVTQLILHQNGRNMPAKKIR